ncbi:PEP-CTERM sorting domain-containing protein [Oceaniferula marina]|nr:PEP-CTERM sorting domain-containing protein [Oceaniferula marina]
MKSTCAIALSFGMATAANAALTVATDVSQTTVNADLSLITQDNASDGAIASSLNDVWVTNSGFTSAVITLELAGGDDVVVDGIAFWNYTPFDSGNGTATATIEFFNDGVSQGTATPFAPNQDSTGSNTPTQQNFVIATQTADTAILTLSTNYGGDRVGFNEIQFDTTAVPEPSSAALIGLGGLSLILRRRK